MRRQLQGEIAVGQRRGEIAALGGARPAARAQIAHIMRRDGEGGAETGDRFRETALAAEGLAKPGVIVGIAGIQPHRLAEVGLRALIAVFEKICEAPEFVARRACRKQFDGFAAARLRLGRSSRITDMAQSKL